MTEPAGMFAWQTELWRQHHDDDPVAVLRCAVSGCRREVGKVWHTERGLLVQANQSRPGRQMPVPLAAGLDADELKADAARRDAHFAAIGDDGVGHSKRQPIPPVLVTLDGDDFDGLPIACPVHGELQFDSAGIRTVCAKPGDRTRALTVWIQSSVGHR